MWDDVSHISNLSLDKRGIRAKRAHFPGFDRVREEKRERGEPMLPPKIYKVPLVDFRQVKNKSSSHRPRGMRGYLKRGISPKIQEGRFWEIEVVGFRRLLTGVSHS